jgi:hypothetical protein
MSGMMSLRDVPDAVVFMDPSGIGLSSRTEYVSENVWLSRMEPNCYNWIKPSNQLGVLGGVPGGTEFLSCTFPRKCNQCLMCAFSGYLYP